MRKTSLFQLIYGTEILWNFVNAPRCTQICPMSHSIFPRICLFPLQFNNLTRDSALLRVLWLVRQIMSL